MGLPGIRTRINLVFRSGLGIPEISISITRIELRMARQGMRIESYNDVQ